MRTAWAAAISILLSCMAVPSAFSAHYQGIAPGVYEVASNNLVNLSIADVHSYENGSGKWILALGLVVENRQRIKASIDSRSFRVLDSSGNFISPSNEARLKNPFETREAEAGEVQVGSVAFVLDYGVRPIMFIAADHGLKIQLDKEVRPPGTPSAIGTPVSSGDSLVGVEGISQSCEGRMLRVDYLLMNNGPGVMLLEGRDYGRFAVLIDAHGWSYSPFDFRILGPAIPPGSFVEGYMTYAVPSGSDPRYLLFWPPDDDAVLFDLGLPNSSANRDMSLREE